MANPVINRLESEWKTQTVPAPGQGANNPYSQTAYTGRADARVSPPVGYDEQAFVQAQEAFYGPAADQVDTGRMTYDDVIVKTGLSLLALLVGGVVGWLVSANSQGLQVGLMVGGLAVGLVLALVITFSKKIRPALILIYSVAEGLVLGVLSQLAEAAFPGVVLQAVVATVIVFAVTLALFASGKVRNSPKLVKFTLIGLLGLLFSQGALWIMALCGVNTGSITGFEVMGIPVSVIVGVLAVFLGALCLISDFDQAQTGVNLGVPRAYAWACAFGMMVTIVWMYVELLRIFLTFYSRD